MICRDILNRIPATHSDRVAIESDACSVSYFELTHASKALAVALQAKDPIDGSAVALCAATSAETITAVLAIHAAGKQWVPLDLDSDEAQIHRTLHETTPATIMLDPQGSQLVHADDDAVIHFSQFPGLVHTYFGQEPENATEAFGASAVLPDEATHQVAEMSAKCGRTAPALEPNLANDIKELKVSGAINAYTADKIAAVLVAGGKIIL